MLKINKILYKQSLFLLQLIVTPLMYAYDMQQCIINTMVGSVFLNNIW